MDAVSAASGDQDHNGIADIPGGQSFLGTDDPQLPIDAESPLRKTRIKPFRMDRTTVTNARFETFVNATNYVTEPERIGDSFVFKGLLSDDQKNAPQFKSAPWWHAVAGACWHDPFGTGQSPEPDHPVAHVTWHDAKAFAKWAGGRLPSEAEWEHAARGGLADVRFPWGDHEPNDTDFFPCNIWQGQFPDHNTAQDGYFATAPAQSYEPNGYGLYNMVGNVWEWTSQPFKIRSLKKDVMAAHAGKQGFKLLKGGSFLCHASYCYRYRIAARSGTSPDSSTSHQGFRLVYGT
ncbi:hypothetical protein GCM10008927_06160 [Amylibacter ulvae]|uniref:Sulfatase-modifying factor enzyme-like domain-containing protein n=2 Tax=Paramylibacter ulvae TaxID=1651968 RepID=A0ABQ3CZX9_9RHOB|nr:hypothetical protein GCM10008927_06160 [Amylibacter ulvae]